MDNIDVRAGNERRKALLEQLMQRAGLANPSSSVFGGVRAIPTARTVQPLNFVHPAQIAAHMGLGGGTAAAGDASAPAVGAPAAGASAPAAPPAQEGIPVGVVGTAPGAAAPPPPAPAPAPAPAAPAPAPAASSTPASGASANPVPLGNDLYYNPQTGQVVNGRPARGTWMT